MAKRHESAADQVWKEKLEPSATPWDAAALVVLILLLVFAV